MKNDFLCHVSDPMFGVNLDNALTNGDFFVAVASGSDKGSDVTLKSKLNVIKNLVIGCGKYGEIETYNHYFDDGINYTESVTFYKK